MLAGAPSSAAAAAAVALWQGIVGGLVWRLVVVDVFDVRSDGPCGCKAGAERMSDGGRGGAFGVFALAFTGEERQQGAQGPFGGASGGACLAAAPSPHRRADRSEVDSTSSEEATNEQYDRRMGAFRGLSVTINSDG